MGHDHRLALDLERSKTLALIGRYNITSVDAKSEKSHLVQLRSFSNVGVYPNRGWADFVLRLQFFRGSDGKYYLFNWVIYAGGNHPEASENERLRSVGATGEKVERKLATFLVPELPAERYYYP